MFEPRGADIPVLFLVLVVLPLVAYILLGKWSEAAKKRERISLLAQVAAEEALKAEAMAAGNAIRLMSSSTSGLHMCARCFAPATTRCARCKSVRYCSGKCQIIHWRKVHRQECEQLETSSSSSSVKTVSVEESLHERVSLNDRMNSQFLGYKINAVEKVTSDDTTYPSLSIDISAAADCSAIGTSKIPSLERTMDNLFSRKSHSEMFTGEDKDVYYKEEQSKTRGTPSIPFNIISSKEAFMRNRSRNSDSVPSEVESPRNRNFNGSNGYVHGQAAAGSTMHKSDRYKSQHGSMFEPRNTCGFSTSSYLRRDGNAPDTREEYDPYGKQKLENNFDTGYFNCSSEMTATTETVKAESGSYSVQTKIYSLPKSRMQVSGEQYGAVAERKGQLSSESKHGRARDILAVQGSDGVAKMGSIKMLGLRKPSELTECTRKDAPITNGKRHKKSKMLFPYEEFLEFFQCEVYDLSPRGLLNCGNSCYANAILQCLTCTKPLIIYLLRRLHSRACCGKDWCLMCELEQHVMMLTESGGPLSPSRILLHIQSINSQIGDGSQEDAHEFLRFLIASMQSICLEGLGGENKVDPRLQETTFIQHVFGGRLRSKVKCMLCQHESERYENIMDLTLEIFGWVESLEDALTQFTTAEDLDGENMYRCGRCAAYVRARKQLSIHEAPNILTIVLKRFQEGKYGKINKWITFPEMLDMIPFMTGTGDIPPLYMLYAVVVHLDSLNASFSGHYVSYIKDMEGNWFRIDDIEVQPVSMSQVMSEGAYILFYMRSCPRPQRTYTDKAVLRKGPDCAKYCILKTRQVPDSAKYCVSKTQKPAKPEEIRPSSHYVGLESSTAPKPDVASSSTMHTSNGTLRRSTSRNVLPVMGACTEPVCLKFSDAMSSDWSLFTSSDEASFTTESTRDSFSTVDYADTWNMDTVSSIFDISNAPRYCGNSAAHRQFSIHRPRVRFLSEQKSHLLDSYLSTQPLNKSQKQEFSNQLADPSNEFSSESHRCTSVKYGSNPIHGLDRTSCHCKV